MDILKFLKKHATLPAVLISGCLSADTPLGIVGGAVAATNPYAAILSQTGDLTPIPLTFTGVILPNDVAINTAGTTALIGGQTAAAAAAATLYIPSYNGDGPLTINVTPLPAGVGSSINSVSLNASSQGLIGGVDTALNQYAARLSPAGAVSVITTVGAGVIRSVSINNFGQGIIGGMAGANMYAAIVPPNSLTPLPNLIVSPPAGSVQVAINNFNQALIGGGGYLAQVSSFGVVTQIPIGTTQITSIALNDSNQGIFGGLASGAGAAYAALLSPSGVVTTIQTGLLVPTGRINDVAINAFGQGIIGGTDGAPAYAALVSASGQPTPIATGITNGAINVVSINNFGQGLIVGTNNATAQGYVAIVSPSGVPTSITTPTIRVDSCAMTHLPAQIPTGSLSKNNLAFANYINANAPQDVFYFIPAMFDGTLTQALESAAPTRNAFSLFAATNNLFYLNNRLSDHLRNGARFRANLAAQKPATVAANGADWSPDELTASASEKDMAKASAEQNDRPYTLWADGIGAWSKQKAQRQTVSFSPMTGAVLVGFDAVLNPKAWIGGGAAYAHTHVHEKHHAGHSNIDQASLFGYASYQGTCFYVDGALWGGWFGINQVRKVHMSGFDFKSTSHPHGWQFAPHLEMGGNYNTRVFTLNPFVMADWANAWQNHYKEKGSGPLNAGQKSHYSSLLRLEAGIRFYQKISFESWRLTFEEKGSYVYQHPFRLGRMRAFLVGAPGTFTVTTLTATQNLGVAEFEILLEPKDPRYPYGSVAYQGEFGSSYRAQQVSLELGWNF